MENPYNQVPYHSAPFPQAHIHRLATMAFVVGLQSPDISRCRVLELGCNDGAHLIPMAMHYPDSQFVGIDLSELAISRATDAAADLGLKNVSFRVGDVAQLSGQPGECDYLIAHGLYSWVPAPVQERLMETFGRLLAPNGVGYISYNCYPAWHVREMTRSVVRIHTAGVSDPVEIRNRGIALLAGMYRSQSEREPYRETLRAEMDRLIAKDPVLTFHDDFAEHNTPIYFSEFIRNAGAHKLQFLSEAETTDMESQDFAPDMRERLSQMADPLAREQLFDFLTLRAFRRTLLCKDDLLLDRSFAMHRLRKLHFSAAIKPTVSAPDTISSASVEFAAQNGSTVTVTQPFVKVVLLELSRAFPCTLPFDYLLSQAAPVNVPAEGVDAESMLHELLVRMHMPGFIEFSLHPWPFATAVSARPLASRLARWQAKNGTRLTSLRHRNVDIDDEAAVRLLPMLDGTRNTDELRQVLPASTATAESVQRGLRKLYELALLEN